MRALLICPRSAISAADMGKPEKAIERAFIREVEIRNTLASYYQVLSTPARGVSSVEFVGPLTARFLSQLAS